MELDRDVYEDGYKYGLTGQYTPDDNPYGFGTTSRYAWGEGFFEGYKRYLSELQATEENV